MLLNHLVPTELIWSFLQVQTLIQQMVSLLLNILSFLVWYNTIYLFATYWWVVNFPCAAFKAPTNVWFHFVEEYPSVGIIYQHINGMTLSLWAHLNVDCAVQHLYTFESSSHVLMHLPLICHGSWIPLVLTSFDTKSFTWSRPSFLRAWY